MAEDWNGDHSMYMKKWCCWKNVDGEKSVVSLEDLRSCSALERRPRLAYAYKFKISTSLMLSKTRESKLMLSLACWSLFQKDTGEQDGEHNSVSCQPIVCVPILKRTSVWFCLAGYMWVILAQIISALGASCIKFTLQKVQKCLSTF